MVKSQRITLALVALFAAGVATLLLLRIEPADRQMLGTIVAGFRPA